MSGLQIETAEGRELLIGRFRDFDELARAVTAWGFDFKQLSGASSPSAVTQVSDPALLIQRFRLGCTYDQRGASPSSARSFGFIEPETRGVRMFGSDCTSSDLVLFRSGGEFESVSRPGFVAWTFSIDEARLEEAIEASDLPRGSRTPAAGAGLLRVDPMLLERLRCRARRLLDQWGSVGQHSYTRSASTSA